MEVCLATTLPWPLRGAISLAILAFNAVSIRGCALLLGSKAVRALEWSTKNEFTVQLASFDEPRPASLAAGSFRLRSLLVLRLRTPAGMRAVLIDGKRQDIRAFRALCQTLGRVSSAGKRPGPSLRESN
jgi:hypothetical protein